MLLEGIFQVGAIFHFCICLCYYLIFAILLEIICLKTIGIGNYFCKDVFVASMMFWSSTLDVQHLGSFPYVLAVMLCIIENIGFGCNTNIHTNCLLFLSEKYGDYYII
jgi:hypothetical protein